MAAPSKGDDAKSHIVTMRVTRAVRDRIQRAADENGRSVSQEIASRLERTFQAENYLGGAINSEVAMLVGATAHFVEMETGKRFSEDRMTWETFREAMLAVLESWQPSIDQDIWDKYNDAFIDMITAARKADDISKKVSGLLDAYPFINEEDQRSGIPKVIADEFDAALAARLAAFEEFWDAAQVVSEGPMREHDERALKARQLGRSIAMVRTGGKSGNFVVLDKLRVFRRDGKVEPVRPEPTAEKEWTDEMVWDLLKLINARVVVPSGSDRTNKGDGNGDD